jgi:hypothetical protein
MSKVFCKMAAFRDENGVFCIKNTNYIQTDTPLVWSSTEKTGDNPEHSSCFTPGDKLLSGPGKRIL